MIITIFGATGRVGRLLTAELLARGHHVRAAVHKQRLDSAAGLESRVVDISDGAAVAAVISGSDAVACALGSWGTADKNIVSTAVQAIVQASPRRLVLVTGSGAALPGEKLPLGARVGQLALMVIAPKILRDAEDALMVLSTSRLDWTAVRSPVMVNGSRAYTLTAKPASQIVSRQAVAAAMTDLLERPAWQGQAPYIGR